MEMTFFRKITGNQNLMERVLFVSKKVIELIKSHNQNEVRLVTKLMGRKIYRPRKKDPKRIQEIGKNLG